MVDSKNRTAELVVDGTATGQVLVCQEGLSFWGGVDPNSGKIIDSRHSNFGAYVAKKIVLMPSSRGSCSGSGVLLQLALSGLAPAALIFCQAEQILTLGAIISDRLFDRPVPIIRLAPDIFAELSHAEDAEIKDRTLNFKHRKVSLAVPENIDLKLTDADRRMLEGDEGKARKIAMEILCLMAINQGAEELLDIDRAHIDGCILAHNANLEFAEKMHQMGAKTCIPTTINAISVDRRNWLALGQPVEFGLKASRLADAYVNMGAQPTFTCAPYLLNDAPKKNDLIGWSESNAVIFANSVIGAWTEKHPDFLDLFIACTGRAPKAGVYLAKNRVPTSKIWVTLPKNFQESIWPMLGYLAGQKSPNDIPLIMGLESADLSFDDLKAFSASFGTTSSAPMFYIKGHMPSDITLRSSQFKQFKITSEDLKKLWKNFNYRSDRIDLVAIGSPHASPTECKKFADLMAGKYCAKNIEAIVTVGRETLEKISKNGVAEELRKSRVRIISDICWCSITEPVFPLKTEVVITNSGKYAYYGKALTGRDVMFGSLEECAKAAVDGQANSVLPSWL